MGVLAKQVEAVLRFAERDPDGVHSLRDISKNAVYGTETWTVHQLTRAMCILVQKGVMKTVSLRGPNPLSCHMQTGYRLMNPLPVAAILNLPAEECPMDQRRHNPCDYDPATRSCTYVCAGAALDRHFQFASRMRIP